ncbi:protein of unknown function [Georgfuchsia toluolica]|uniref:Uncharacterized protein n=1 Tax=Georgfuchsia toluolica TaxID=424218 RepID=A0A916N0R1_9PROT|nr:hypothetical protein [Georgfuchsia toluolica]CAG4884183.1 protein of unknown function [Georgfuchsia toluolica]
MLTLIKFIQLPEQERLSLMKKNVVQADATDHNMKNLLDSKLMSFKKYAQNWLNIITKYADYQLNKDAVATDSKAAASRSDSEPVQDQHHQPTGESHA